MAFGRICGLVFGAAVVLGTALPASANLHRSDIGVRYATGERVSAPLFVGASSSAQYSASACSWQRQKFWDGYSWRVQRSQICE